MGSWLEVA